MIPPLERVAVALALAATAGVVAHVGLRGLGVAPLPAVIVVLALGAALVAWLARRVPPEVDGFLARRPGASAAWLLLVLAAVGQTWIVSRDMLADAPAPASGTSVVAAPPHCCLTAPVEAARYWRAGEPNIYRDDLYGDRRLAGYRVDPYFYPPPFLLPMLGVRAAVGDDFRAHRRVCFAFYGLALLLAIALVTVALEPAARPRALALAPALWASLPVQLGLKIVNAQALVIALAMLACVALLKRRSAAGGALLAAAIAIKLSPGILLVRLARRRRWRDLAWTIAAGAAIGLVAVLVLGWAPFRSFVEYQLPRLSSGEACRREFANAVALARDLSPFALPLKLGLLGVPGMTLATGHAVSVVYGIGIVLLALWSARRAPATPGEAVCTWLALLSLGMLAGPFAPADYAPISVIWLLCLDRRLVRAEWAAAAALLTIVPYLIPRASAAWIHVAAHAPMQVLVLLAPILVLVRAGRAQPSGTSAAI